MLVEINWSFFPQIFGFIGKNSRGGARGLGLGSSQGLGGVWLLLLWHFVWGRNKQLSYSCEGIIRKVHNTRCSDKIY